MFSDINVSRGSVATYARTGGIAYNHFTANKFRKAIMIGQNYGQEFVASFFLSHSSRNKNR